jgi:4-amino-4-deoxy-L-arabinose transferase-like glycosyltransferase
VERPHVTTKGVIIALAAIFLLNLLLRIFYLRYDFVNGDEAVRAITAVRLIEGGRLYTDIVTDKPPGTTFFYAAVFWLFGHSMVAVHLVAALWNFATSVVLYSTGARFYDRRTGLAAALLFVYFGTNYYTQDMMAANTELLMVLPYTASFYFFLKARTRRFTTNSDEPAERREWTSLFLAGLLTGVAALFKQVGLINLLCFALHEIFELYRTRREGFRGRWKEARKGLTRLLISAAGFVVVALMLVLWLRTQGNLSDFWHSVFEMGSVYVSALPLDLWLKFMFGRTMGYVLFNLALWLLAGYAVVRSLRGQPRGAGVFDGPQPALSGETASSNRETDLLLALWAGVSLLAAFSGGRFFGHYFIQVLPALSLLGSRGLGILIERLGDSRTRRRAGTALAVLTVVFIFGFVRFHQRTAVLAYEAIASVQTAASESWGMTQRQKEAEIVARRLRETVSEGEPIYIWGFALDVYWRSRCRPASRYLLPYYMTGRLQETGIVDPHNEEFWSEARARFIDDLARERPRLILDVESNLLSPAYPEIEEFVKATYQRDGEIGVDPDRPFVVYRLKE